MKSIKEIFEEVSTTDVAMQGEIIGADSHHRSIECFDIEDQSEFHSFCKGIKSFHRWRKHTKSEKIRKWANQNRGKDFYIHHNGAFMKIRRSK